MKSIPFFFGTKTRSVEKQSTDYLYGQLITKQRQNTNQYYKEVPDSNYDAMNHFISNSPWDEPGLRKKLRTDTYNLLFDPINGAIILDESGIPKQGKMSVGVQRQWCGRLGKTENCQVGVYLAYSNEEHVTLVDHRLYLPKSWAYDIGRRRKAGVPDDVTFKTKAELGLEMILDFKNEGRLFSWVGMDGHYGEQTWLLKRLDKKEIIYMADIPCTTHIFLKLPKTEIPERRSPRGRYPTKEKLVEGESPPNSVREYRKTLSESDYTRIIVRKTERGFLIADFHAVRVWHSVGDLPFQEVWLIIRREINKPNEIKYSLSNAPIDTPLEQIAKMQCRRYWVERALEDAKGEAGLDEYQIRGWRGWHNHMTMTLLAMLFLLSLVLDMNGRAPMLTIQDAREILETFLPRKTYSPDEFLAWIERKHHLRQSARKSHAKNQNRWLENRRI